MFSTGGSLGWPAVKHDFAENCTKMRSRCSYATPLDERQITQSSYPAEARKWKFSPFFSAKGGVKLGVIFSVLRFPGFGCATENLTKISRQKRCGKRNISRKFHSAGAQRSDYSSNLCPPKIWSIWLFQGELLGLSFKKTTGRRPKSTPLEKSYRSYFRRAQIRWVIWRSSTPLSYTPFRTSQNCFKKIALHYDPAGVVQSPKNPESRKYEKNTRSPPRLPPKMREKKKQLKKDENGPKITIFVVYSVFFVFSGVGGFFCFFGAIFRIQGFSGSVPPPQDRKPYTIP